MLFLTIYTRSYFRDGDQGNCNPAEGQASGQDNGQGQNGNGGQQNNG